MNKNKSLLNRTNQTRGSRAFDILNIAFMVAFSALCLYPFLNIVALSFNSGTDSMRGGITLWPREFTLANYQIVLKNGLVIEAYKVTIARTVIGTLGTLTITAMAAYAVSEKGLPGKRAIMVYMMITMFFGGGLIPSYLSMRAYGLLNTFWVFVIPGLFNVWTCIIMKTSFSSIPLSLKESMRLDGASEFGILLHIVLPVSMPMFAALGLFAAVGHWNDWFSGAYYVRDNTLIPVQTYLYNIMAQDMTAMAEKSMLSGGTTAATNVSAELLTEGGSRGGVTSMSIKMSIVVIGTAPILCLYPFLQKYFVKGVLIGSIKE